MGSVHWRGLPQFPWYRARRSAQIPGGTVGWAFNTSGARRSAIAQSSAELVVGQ